MWLKIKQTAGSMFQLTRVPCWYRFSEPQPHGTRADPMPSDRLRVGQEVGVVWLALFVPSEESKQE